MRGKRIAILIGLLAFAAAAFAQQITRIAVVDLPKVIAAYSKDAQAVKDFEQKKSQTQTDIDRMSADIMRLMTQKADADKVGDKAGGLRLREEIDRKTKSLTDFVSVKQAELDEQAKKLAATDAFSQDLYKQIQNVAETEGYSLVINLKSGDTVMNAVLWYSPMIDITSDVIQALTGRAQ
ncbi:MAG: OmpH family outer membrane protein [Rectinemataceae bacterium]|jgi:outer membrane protein